MAPSVTEDYLAMFLNLKIEDPNTVLASFFLTLARILPIMAIVPFFGGSKLLPRPVKIMFAISIVAIIFPQTLMTIHEKIGFNALFIGFLLKELFIGFILAFLASIPFYIAEGSGSLIDHIRGSSALQVTDPVTQTQTGPMGNLYNYILIASFFFIGGPIYFINGITKSFELIPINKFFSPLFFTLKLPFWQMIVGLLDHVISLSLQLGAPSIVGILMTEMFLGIANRLAPQVQIVFLGISLKSWIGLGLLAAAWYFILQQLGKESLIWIKTIDTTMEQTIRL